MKALIVVITSLFFISSHTSAEESGKVEITDTFTDAIKGISEEEKGILIRFNHHAALYRLAKGHSQFTEIKQKIEKLQKSSKKIKVTVIIPTMEIKNITE